jgi:hypothetical protein
LKAIDPNDTRIDTLSKERIRLENLLKLRHKENTRFNAPDYQPNDVSERIDPATGKFDPYN